MKSLKAISTSLINGWSFSSGEWGAQASFYIALTGRSATELSRPRKSRTFEELTCILGKMASRALLSAGLSWLTQIGSTHNTVVNARSWARYGTGNGDFLRRGTT